MSKAPKFLRRAMAFLLSAATMISATPVYALSDADLGIMPIGEEENKASSVVLKVGDKFAAHRNELYDSTFLTGTYRHKIGQMALTMSDGTEAFVFCADYTKHGPPEGGSYPVTIASKVNDTRLLGVVANGNGRLSIAEFRAAFNKANKGVTLDETNFTYKMYYSASQVAVWTALGDVYIDDGSLNGVTWPSSVSLGYTQSGGRNYAETTTDAITLLAATYMLEQGNIWKNAWSHPPYTGAEISYSPGNDTYNSSNRKTGTINVGTSIASSSVFAEKQIDGKTYLVLPMASSSATFVRGYSGFVRMNNAPDGAFLMDENGTKSRADGASQILALTNIKETTDTKMYPNANNRAWSETFFFCIPKETAEVMDAAGTKITADFVSSMNVDRYNAYIATPDDNAHQPMLVCEPAVVLIGAKVAFAGGSETPVEPTEDKASLKIIKTDKAGAGLQGCSFELTYVENGTIQKKAATTDGNGEVFFDPIPLQTDVTVKETAAPEGYTLLPSKTINTGSKGGQVLEYAFVNSDDHTFTLKKISSADGHKLMGATFEIKGIGHNYVKTFTTDAMGEIVIQGRDLPVGSYEIYEVNAPDGYAVDGSNIQTFEWDNTKDQSVTFKNASQPSIQIHKFDKDTLTPLEGATFEIRQNGQVLQTVKTDQNGMATVSNLAKGFYQVVEIEPPAGYLKDDHPYEVYIDPSADPTQLIREVNVANTKKLSLRIIKIDKETKVPLKGWEFVISKDGRVITTATTDENGEIMLTGLEPGTYLVHEKNGDTEHYNMDAPDQEIEIVKEQDEIPTMVFENTVKKHFGILKVDSETRRPIPGVTFAIYRDGKLLGNYVTDDGGRIYLPYTEPGTYQAQEINTDPRYVLNETMFTIENNSEYPTFFTIPNVMKKDITVRKIDKDTGRPLAGVVFEGFRDGKSIGYFTTGADGTFTIPYAESGTYVFKEYHTLSGHVLNTEPILIEHTTDGNVDIVVDNVEKKDFEILKVDADTKQPLAGIQFKVWRDDQLLGDYTTDENGRILIDHAPAGTYRVQEAATLDGYILNDKVYAIEHTTEKSSSLTIENTKCKNFTIIKVDADTKQPIPNVQFKVWRDEVFLGDSFITDENGQIVIENAEPGTYRVQEYQTVTGYILSEEEFKIEHTDKGPTKLTVPNKKQPGLLIKKVDANTNEPLSHARFKVTRADGSIITEDGETDAYGVLHLPNLDTGDYIVVETKAPDGYILDDMPKTVHLEAGKTYTVTFENGRAYGLQIRKLIKGTNQPLSGCTFTVAQADGKVIGTYKTDNRGLATVSGLADGVYVVTETRCPEGYRLDGTPQNVIVKAGELATVTFENEKLAGVRIKKIDAKTKKGIYGVRFLIKDEDNNLIGEYSTDQDGYIELDDILTDGASEVKLKVEEIAAADGYVLDDTVRTLRVRRGKTTELVVENTPILGQIQVVKRSSQDNPVTNEAKGSLLAGAKFEITNAETGRVVDTMTSDARGIAASNPIPLGRYYVQEVQAPRFYQLNSKKVEVKLKVEGDVVQIEMYNDAATIKTDIKKTGNYTVDAGSNMRYDFTGIGNYSNVALDNFFWHDRIPTDAVRAATLTTGTFNARVWYKINYKTNLNGYRALASNLLSTERYSFKIDAASLKLASEEYVTDIRFEFGTVPPGFKMTEKATLFVYVPDYMGNGYNIINRADAGGSYQGEWDSSSSTWVTKIYRAPTYSQPTLPKTGY